jgi:hypothetical protein
MRAYRETFSRHRVLFLLPALLFALAAGYLTLGAAKTYESDSSLWVDNAVSAGSSLSNSQQAVEPSTLEQTILTELLATQNFDVTVGDGSGLKSIEAAGGGGQQKIDMRIAAAVSGGVTSATPGPQVLQLSFVGPTPAVAEGTLGSLMTQLQSSTAQYAHDFSQTSQSYYQDQVNTAHEAVTKATDAATGYQRSHPKSTTQNDQNYAALVAAVTSATTQLASATSSLNQAQGQSQGGSAGTTVRVLDTPSTPTGPVSGKKKALIEIIGAMIAGLLLSVLAIVAITPGGADRADADILSGDLPGMPMREVPVRRTPPARQLPTPRPGTGQGAPVRRGPQAPVRRVTSKPVGKALNPPPAARPRPRPAGDEQPEKESA